MLTIEMSHLGFLSGSQDIMLYDPLYVDKTISADVNTAITLADTKVTHGVLQYAFFADFFKRKVGYI